MNVLYKILRIVACFAMLVGAGVCGWLFLYTRDLPDFEHLSQFAPSDQSATVDSCLASPSTPISFDRIGRPLKDAFAAAEPNTVLSDEIARSLMCNHSGGMGKYHLNSFRLSWHIRRRFSDQQLVAIYLNRAYFGEGISGVENASKEFLHKEPSALSIDQAALMVGLLRAPDYFSPRKHPERALQRRNKVLEDMVIQRKLSASDATRLEAIPTVFY